MDDYLDTLTTSERTTFLAIAQYAFSLGYKVKKDKSKTLGYTFTHGKIKKQMLRFSRDHGRPMVRLKFFASPSYSQYFHEAIRSTIEEYNFKYTGCYGCGNCNGTQGYTYRYPDGREYYRCGSELIELYDIEKLPLQELFDLLKTQHDFYLSGNQTT